MEKEFEDVLRKHKADMPSPPPAVWNKLQDGLVRHHHRKTRIIKIRLLGLSTAASVIIIAGIFFITVRTKQNDPVVSLAQDKILKDEKDNNTLIAGLADRETSRSIVYYTRQIESKQQQFNLVKNMDPELYIKAQKSILDMKQVFEELRRQLTKSINRKKILETMIENLRIQEQILNNQLQLIQELQMPNQTIHAKNSKAI